MLGEAHMYMGQVPLKEAQLFTLYRQALYSPLSPFGTQVPTIHSLGYSKYLIHFEKKNVARPPESQFFELAYYLDGIHSTQPIYFQDFIPSGEGPRLYNHLLNPSSLLVESKVLDMEHVSSSWFLLLKLVYI